MATRPYNIKKETEQTRLARRFWNEPGTAQQHALQDIMLQVEKTETLHDAALRVRAEYIAVTARIEVDKKLSYISRHTIENMQARARVYKAWYSRFIEG